MRFGLAGLAALAACSLHVDPNGTLFKCDDANPECPDGYVCRADRCVPTEVPVPACATSVATGIDHSCAIRTDGTVWCWGRNEFGQLGDGTTTDRTVPVQVVPGSGVTLPTFTAVAGGHEHTCALGTDHSVWCWGHNSAGQLGAQTSGDARSPQAVSGLGGATAIAVGGFHSCAIKSDGDHPVACWGANNAGQLATGGTDGHPLPTTISGMTGAVAIAAGGDSTCAIDGHKQLWCWGDNVHGQLANGMRQDQPQTLPVQSTMVSDAAGVAVGAAFSCVLTSAGAVSCFGQNLSGQLGDAVDPGMDHTTAVPILFKGTAVSIAAGQNFACLTDDKHAVWCWGQNDNYQLGDTSANNSATPVLAQYPGASAVAAGGAHTCVLASSGAILCSGYDAWGQLGDGKRTTRGTPQEIDGIDGVVSIASGDHHSCAVRMDGTVMCWGGNDSGELGDGTRITRSVPVQVAGLANVQAVVTGFNHSCALQGGTVQCWGGNDHGQLGDQMGDTRSYPRQVPNLSMVDQIAAGVGFTCALAMGKVSCWGVGGFGQLGNDPPADSGAPVAVAGLTQPVTAIGVGDFHGCAINHDGTVSCWGSNGNGQRGDGTDGFTAGAAPTVSVPGLSGVADKVTAGDSFTCAHTMAGDVFCWGYGFQGEIGTSMDRVFLVPQQVTSLKAIDKVFSGGSHSCAIKGGAMSCWGTGFFGEIGDGFYNQRDSPNAVTAVMGATLAAPGERHTCAVIAGKVSCWGDDRLGQLGDGVVRSTEPVGVLMTCP